MQKLFAAACVGAIAIAACSSGPVAPRDNPGPGPGPDTTTTPQPPGAQPPPLGSLRQNMPSGWSVVSDYGFDDALPAHQDGVSWEVPMGSSGWRAVDWGSQGGAIRRMSDGSSPASGGYVLEEVYPPHLSGTGPSKVTRSISAADRLYISWVVKWEAGFHHNGTSEKLIYFNLGAGSAFLFQFQYGVEMMYGVQDATGYEALRANQVTPNWAGHGDAQPVNDVWLEYELLFDRSTGTVKWWRNGVLHGNHSGRSFPAISVVEITATWGGGGDKQGTHSRYTDHFFMAVN